MTNNTEIQKNIENSAKVGVNLCEVNIKNLTALSNLQINLFDNYLKTSVSNAESLSKVKDQKTFQDYFVSLKTQTEKQITNSAEKYVSFFQDYTKQVTDVLADTKAIKVK